jgi:DNA-binding transcriptional regulator GbsR (MarR family)
LTPVQWLSHLLLGRRYRLEAAAAIAMHRERGEFTVPDLAADTPLTEQQISQEVRLLRRCGLVKRLGRGIGNRVEYSAPDHEFWEFARATVEHAHTDATASTPR